MVEDIDTSELLFGRPSPPDLWKKAQRELKRLKQAPTPEDRIDGAQNFAVTAWALIEHFYQDGVARSETFKSLFKNLTTFQGAARNSIQNLEIVQAINDAFKHRIITRYSPPIRSARFQEIERFERQLVGGNLDLSDQTAEYSFTEVHFAGKGATITHSDLCVTDHVGNLRLVTDLFDEVNKKLGAFLHDLEVAHGLLRRTARGHH